jgi:hypothetical protein
MARCGRCGLWSKYPDNHHEKKYAGVCLWYQTRLVDSEVFDERECKDFFEGVPGMTAMNHMDYKIKRDNLGDAFKAASFSKRLAIMGAVISVISLTVSLWRVFHG